MVGDKILSNSIFWQFAKGRRRATHSMPIVIVLPLLVAYVCCAQSTQPTTTADTIISRPWTLADLDLNIGPFSQAWITVELLGYLKVPSSDVSQTSISVVRSSSFVPAMANTQTSARPLPLIASKEASNASTLSASMHSSYTSLPGNAWPETSAQGLVSKTTDATFVTPILSPLTARPSLASSILRPQNQSAESLSRLESLYKSWTLPSLHSIVSDSSASFLSNPTAIPGIQNGSLSDSTSMATAYSYRNYTGQSNMTIFTGFGKPIQLELPRYAVILASTLPLLLFLLV